MLNFQDIIAAYKINPNQEINKSWDFPDETPIIAYNVTQRYEELRSEGKSNDEIKNILLTEVEQKFKATSQQDELVQTINQLTTAKDGDA